MTEKRAEPFTAVPVEYGVAVERYLSELRLGATSRRVYRIALATWARALLDGPSAAPRQRGLRAPVLPLGALDHRDAPDLLRSAVDLRAATIEPRTLQREVSILRGATAWWRAQGWIERDPAVDLRAPTVPPPDTPLSPQQVGAVFQIPAALREQALWHLVYESAAPVERLLALSVAEIDHERRRSYWDPGLRWDESAAHLLGLVTLGRFQGPVFLTERRRRSARPEDRCVLTGRGRLSHRRAAELFTSATRPLDPHGRGWSLRQLRVAGRRHARDRDASATTPGTR